LSYAFGVDNLIFWCAYKVQ